MQILPVLANNRAIQQRRFTVDHAEKKQKWFNEMAKVFGTCMKVAYCNGIPIDFMQFAPAKCFLRIKEYASEPPSNDAVFLACLYITDNKYRGKGLGTKMLKDFAEQLRNDGVKAVETFARKCLSEKNFRPVKTVFEAKFQIKNRQRRLSLSRFKL